MCPAAGEVELPGLKRRRSSLYGWSRETPGPVTPFLLLPQEIPHLTGENRQVTFDDTPDNLIRNSCVAMDQAVPECDDQGCIGDLPLEVRLSPQKMVQRFADDLKLPLHRKTGAWDRRDTPRRSCRR